MKIRPPYVGNGDIIRRHLDIDDAPLPERAEMVCPISLGGSSQYTERTP
ncbi:MAG: hypothetical protein WCF40_14395 [Desulfobacterales bacterium]